MTHCMYMLFASYFGFDLVIVQIGRSSQNSHWPHALLRLLHDLRFSNFFSSKFYGRKNRSYFGSHTSLEVWSSSVHNLALLSAISFTLFYTSKITVYKSCDKLSILVQCTTCTFGAAQSCIFKSLGRLNFYKQLIVQLLARPFWWNLFLFASF